MAAIYSMACDIETKQIVWIQDRKHGPMSAVDVASKSRKYRKNKVRYH